MNLRRYTDPINEQLKPIRLIVASGTEIHPSKVKRVRKAVTRLYADAVRDINIRSSRGARYRSYLRDPERVVLLERLAIFIDSVLVELARVES